MPTLDEHLPGPLASVRFFNGRLLTGTDLTREQVTLYERDARVAAALGSGVVVGLEVSEPESSTATLPQIHVTAGRGITPGGAILVLEDNTTVDLTLPATTPPPPRSDWRRCADAPSDPPPTGPDRGLYLLVLRWLPKDSTTLARVLQADRSTDPCTVDSVDEGVCFRLVRMSAVETATAAIADDRLQNAVAHACFGTAGVPADPAGDTAGRAMDQLRAAGDLTACDLPLAVLCITRSEGVRWYDAWAARRRPTPPLGHTTLERATGPRALAEAEARLLQFQGQLEGLATPSGGGLSGTAQGRFVWVPPAGHLPAEWASTEAWRAFFGSAMAPPSAIACDAALLPPLLANAALGAAIPTESAVVSVPAIDVYAGRADGEGADAGLVYVQSADGRVRVELTGTALTTTVASTLVVRATSADGRRSWDAVRDTSGAFWLTPNLPPGAYSLDVVSDAVAGAPTTLNVVGGRVRRSVIAVTALTGTIRVTVEEDKYTDTYEVRATKGSETRTVLAPTGGAWVFSGVPLGAWTVQARAHGRYGLVTSGAELAQVAAGATTPVTLEFQAAPTRPEPSLTFPWRKGWVKLALVELSITADDDGMIVVKDTDAWFAYRLEEAARDSYLEQLDREKNFARTEVEIATGERTPDGSPIVFRGPRSKGTRKRTGTLDTVKNTSGYSTWADPPEEVRAWLAAWQKWIGGNEVDPRTRGKVRDTSPFIELQTGKDIVALAASTSTPRLPEGYAVFGRTRMPLVVTRERYRIPGRHVPDTKASLLDRIKGYQRSPDWSIDELASWPGAILDDVFPVPIGDPEELVKDLGASAVQTKETFAWLPGVDSRLIEATGGSLAAIANLDQGALMQMGYDGTTAAVLLAEARMAAPAAAWSTGGAGITGGAILENSGFETVKSVASAAPERIAATLGVTESAAREVIAEAQSKLVEGVTAEALSVVTTLAAAETSTAEVDVASFAAGSGVELGVSSAFVEAGVKATGALNAAIGALGVTNVSLNTTVKLGG